MILRRTAVALAGLLVMTAFPVFAQVIPSAEQGGLPLVAGAGVSSFNLDWGHDDFGHKRYMEAVTVWFDWNLTRLPGPSLLRGFGVEVEGRDIDFGLPASLSDAELHDTGTNMRQGRKCDGL
jgi:hypothetical protein